MKNSKMNIYDNEYYEKKYNKYKQKYLSASKKQHGGGQNGGSNVIEFDKTVKFDKEFRMNPLFNNIKDLVSDKIIVRSEKNVGGRNVTTVDKISMDVAEQHTYSPLYALIDDTFKINSCIPYQFRPVSVFLKLLCKISQMCKCLVNEKTIQCKNPNTYGLYKKDSVYYEPMVPVISVIEHISDPKKIKDEKYNKFLNEVEKFINNKLHFNEHEQTIEENKIIKYLKSTEIYTTVPNLLELITELRNVSFFSHKYFSRISHLRTLPISYFINNPEDVKQEKYYTDMLKKLEDNIFARLSKIYKFIFDIELQEDPEIVKFLKSSECTFNNNFFIFNKNDLHELLKRLFYFIDHESIVEKQFSLTINHKIRIKCKDKEVLKSPEELNLATYNSRIKLHESIYDATKTILTYLSYKELEKTHDFIKNGFPLLFDKLNNIEDEHKSKSLEVLATDVFIVQDGCFLCEQDSNTNEMVSAEDVNDITFVSLCGFDFSILSTTHDNKTYFNGNYQDDNTYDNNKMVSKFHEEYYKIFRNLLDMCKVEKIKYLSMVPFGVGAFLEFFKDYNNTKYDGIEHFLIAYVYALRKALIDSNYNITLYISFGSIKDQLINIFSRDENGTFSQVNGIDETTNLNDIKIDILGFTLAKENTEITVEKSKVVLHGKDGKSVAIQLRKKLNDENSSDRVGFINASDFIALIFGKIGYYTLEGYSDRFAGEEDFASTSTGMLACDDVYKSLGFDIEYSTYDETINEIISKRKEQITKYNSKKKIKNDDYNERLNNKLKKLPKEISETVSNAAVSINSDKTLSQVQQNRVMELLAKKVDEDPNEAVEISTLILEGKKNEVVSEANNTIVFRTGKLNKIE